MLVSLFSSQVLTAAVSNPVSTKTRAIEVGQHNYANITLNVRDIVGLSGSPTVNLTVDGEGSIDGQNWVTIADLDASADAVGVVSGEDYVLYPWLRFDINLTVTGSAGDQAQVVFGLDVNIIAY